MRIQHPLEVGTCVIFDSKKCNCYFLRKQPKRGKIVRVLNFNGVIWYEMDDGNQIHRSKVITTDS